MQDKGGALYLSTDDTPPHTLHSAVAAVNPGTGQKEGMALAYALALMLSLPTMCQSAHPS